MPVSKSIDERLYSLKSYAPWRDPRPARIGGALFFLLELLFLTPTALATELALAMRGYPEYARLVGHPTIFGFLYSAEHLLAWYLVLVHHLSIVASHASAILATHALQFFLTIFIEFMASLLVRGMLWWFMGNILPDYYGSARTAEAKEMDAAGVFKNDGVHMGFCPYPVALLERVKAVWRGDWRTAFAGLVNRIVRAAADFHTIIFGPTGTGKTQDYIIPTNVSWEGSLFAYALKAEIINNCVGFRASAEGMNSDLHVIMLSNPDPDDPGDSRLLGVIGSKWEGGLNPLDAINCYEDAREIVLALRSETLADPSKENASGSFFTVGSTEYLEIVFTWLRYRLGADASIGRALRLISLQQTPADILQEIAFKPHDVHGRCLWYDEHGNQVDKDPTIAQIANLAIVQLTVEQLQSIVKNATVYLSPWHNQLVARATSRTTFDPRRLRKLDYNATIIMFSPYSRKKTNAPVVSVCTTAFLRMVARGDCPYKHARGRVLVELDEADSLNVPALDEDANELRSTGISLLLSYQGYRQLIRKHGPQERLTMAANAKVYIRSGESDTSGQMLRDTGKQTIRGTQPPSYSNHDYGGSFHDFGRELLTEDETARIPNDRAVAILRQGAPGRALLPTLYLHRAHAIDEPEFAYRISRPLPWSEAAAQNEKVQVA